MPGIAAVVPANASPRAAAESLGRMVPATCKDPSWHQRSWQAEGGRCGLAAWVRQQDDPASIAQLGDATLILDGELFGVPCDRDGHAAYLLRRWEEDGAAALRGLEGRFVAVVWSAERQQLTLLTDKFASKPVYFRSVGGEFAAGTSISALRDQAAGPLSWNLDGLVQFLTFGQLWNNDTFYDSISAAGPAAEIVFDAASGEVAVRQYWRPAAPSAGGYRRDLDALTAAFATSVDEQSRDTPGLGVALSGGLDARTMLAYVDTESLRPPCVSLGMEGSLDQRSARRLADLAGCPFHSLVLGEGFLEHFSRHLRRMVELTDGHYLSQCIVMPTFPLYQQLGVRVLMRGHVGELLHMHKAYNFSVDSGIFDLRQEAALEDWLWQRLPNHLTAGVAEPVLQGVEPSEFSRRGRDSLRRAIADTRHLDHPLDRISQLFLDQRTRRETAMSLVKFGSVVDTRMPYLQGELIEAVLAIDPALRVGESIQTHLLRARRPDFLRPANSNTGAPVGASPLYRQFCYLRMRVLAKLGVKGYQPYERLGLWLRRELRGQVEAILLSPACLDRGLFHPDCIRASVRRHISGEANHTYLLMAMMIVELGMRGVRQETELSAPGVLGTDRQEARIESP